LLQVTSNKLQVPRANSIAIGGMPTPVGTDI